MKTSNNNQFVAAQVETLHYSEYVKIINDQKREARRAEWKEVVAAANAVIEGAITAVFLAIQNLKIAVPVALTITAIIAAYKYL